ncbi:hypothetical protein [Nitrosopumilus sp.]|uniref:hypothetical protein n=1 Tax=Nitrosopumilus sp. TaxID=2024843 RepID=UPI0029309531|nr:hypothetical protein [Nitrosopumilus sp.]
MNSSTKKSIQQLLYYRRHIKSNSISSQILELLYTNRNLTLKEITNQFDSKYYLYVKKVVLYLKRNGYLDIDNHKQYNRNYSLTQMGRWFTICTKLDIPFLSLCLISDVYCTVKDQSNNNYKIYLISSFRRLFDSRYNESISAIYSEQNIYKSIRYLIEKNLIGHISKDIIKMNDATITKLNQYNDDLNKLHHWIYDVSVECKDFYLENNDVPKQLLSLIKHNN